MGRGAAAAGAARVEMAVSPIAGRDRAGSAPAARVRSRDSSESTAAVSAVRSRQPAITNIEIGRISAILCRTTKRFIDSDRSDCNCRMVTTRVEGERTNPGSACSVVSWPRPPA